jgi:hypothetical protein
VTKEQSVPFPYEHVTAFLARHLGRIPFVRRIERRVALHYHTGFEQSVLDWQNTRTILRAIPGLDLVDVANPTSLGRHCAPKWIGRIGRSQWQREITGVLDAARDARVDVLARRAIEDDRFPHAPSLLLARQLTRSTVLSAQISILGKSADLPSAYFPRRST